MFPHANIRPAYLGWIAHVFERSVRKSRANSNEGLQAYKFTDRNVSFQSVHHAIIPKPRVAL